MKIISGPAGQIGSPAAPDPSPPEELVTLEYVELREYGDGRLADPPRLEQDVLPVDGEAAIHLAPECAEIQWGVVQG
jgi:hypothetical protein